MNCTLTLALISETQEGNIGEDWKYHLSVKAFEDDLDGEASISVPKHTLPSGEIREPFGSPAPVTVFSGECKSGFLVRMKLTATEVDMFINDVGKVEKELRIDLPAPGGGKVTKEVDLAAGVRESPGIIPKSAVFTVRVRLTLACA
ncbi:MAG: hypothetical protein EHM68_06645 [Lysobacterales bacterium]|jgi:hypothetical protein|nr:MAG: hypothetical protein EHM68_06645 [Xanthomonadales bacterium]